MALQGISGGVAGLQGGKTVTLERLEGFRGAGINRLSFGVQSFHDDDLKFLTRIHDADQARAAALREIDGDRQPGADLRAGVAMNQDRLVSHAYLLRVWF